MSGCGFQPQYLHVDFRVPLRLEAAATILKTPSESRRKFGTMWVSEFLRIQLNGLKKLAQNRRFVQLVLVD